MNHVTVVTGAVESFAASAAALSAATAAAGTADAAVQTAVMTGAFGLIGQEFLAAFALAQANHLASVAALAVVQSATAGAATAGLAALHGSDAAAASGIGPA
ncbi:hypothetical protein GOHSU_06_00020 [Gordonia hirsuta DSM 44140 = NBRC 16056]|uniref:PE domain-containing protein n=1 Tax=Gordonia hirsuta DSM 44140 = NBRC 16056 TaxID=1121927 RepID=L7L6L4_9ACTN|nr:hypothetical protein [Gordonia hirsuta]GAC56391.1 hypothetical protein GOHSU_06_00020 [Gordonia hirsuta DSM 44140 = NBRC 16056]